MGERKRWAAYRVFDTEDVRAFGETPLLAISVVDARRGAESGGVLLDAQPTMIAWQYYAEKPRFDGSDHMFICPAEESLFVMLTLHFNVIEPTVMVDVVPSL